MCGDWRSLEQSLIDDAVDQWLTRLHAYIRVNGGHFEHNLLSCLPICFLCIWWTTFHTTLDAVDNILRVHYKSMKCDVLFSKGSVNTLFRRIEHCFSCICKNVLPAYISANFFLKNQTSFSRVMITNVLPRFFLSITVYILCVDCAFGVWIPYFHCVSKTSHIWFAITLTDVNAFLYFFGRNVTDKVHNQKILYHVTSNNVCYCTTWKKGKHENRIFSLKCSVSALPEFNQSPLDFFSVFDSRYILMHAAAVWLLNLVINALLGAVGGHGLRKKKLTEPQQLDCVAHTMHVHQCAVSRGKKRGLTHFNHF